MGKILLVRHRITVDGKVIYEGDECGEQGRDVYRIVMDAIAHPARQVVHQILKQVVDLDADPPIIWHWTSVGGEISTEPSNGIIHNQETC